MAGELELQLRQLTVGRLLHSEGRRACGRGPMLQPLPPPPLPLQSAAAAVSALRADGAERLVSTSRCPSGGADADGATFSAAASAGLLLSNLTDR